MGALLDFGGGKWWRVDQSGQIGHRGISVFRGRYEHSVDEKGRVALPAAFRRVLADESQLVLTTHISEPCLVAYPMAEWRAFEGRLSSLPQFDPDVMVARRLYVGSAMDCPIDRQGRLLLPSVLRDYAGIERDASWVGNIKTMELWSKLAWTEREQGLRSAVAPELLQKLGELGL